MVSEVKILGVISDGHALELGCVNPVTEQQATKQSAVLGGVLGRDEAWTGDEGDPVHVGLR